MPRRALARRTNAKTDARPRSRSQAKAPTTKPAKRVQKAASLGLAAVVAVSLQVAPARADLTSDLLAKTEANKELNDKKRAATSSANFERSRTVTDGFCNFPQNIFGCENAAEKGDVKFLSDDLKVECEGTDAGKICASKNSGSYPSFLGL